MMDLDKIRMWSEVFGNSGADNNVEAYLAFLAMDRLSEKDRAMVIDYLKVTPLRISFVPNPDNFEPSGHVVSVDGPQWPEEEQWTR